MSTTAYPFGMIPNLQLASAYNTQGFSQYEIVDGYSTSIFFGDVVKLATTGYIQKDTGTTTLTPMGIFLGCSYVQPNTGYFTPAQYWPASTTTGVTAGAGRPMAFVLNDPNGVFTIQADATLTIAAKGANAAIVQGSGVVASGKSANSLSASSVNTTDTLPLRIIDIWDAPGNAWGDDYPILLVKFNNHAFTTLTAI